MGSIISDWHYECYEAEYKLQEKRKEELKRKYPNDPSKWGISLSERIGLIEQRVFNLESRGRYLK